MDAGAVSGVPNFADSPNGTVASRDAKRGVPAFLWVASPQAAAFSSRSMDRPAEDIARDFLTKNMAQYGLSKASIDAAYVRHVHDTGRGGIIVVFAQKVDGVEVWHNELKVLLDRQGDVIAAGGNLRGDAISTLQGGAPYVFAFPADGAIARACTEHAASPVSRLDLVESGREENGYRTFELRSDGRENTLGLHFARAARVKQVLYALPDRLVPAYYLEVDLQTTGTSSADLWGYVVSAENGELLERNHLTNDAAFQYKVWADAAPPNTPLDGPIADWTPHPTGFPNGASPAFIAPTLISMDGFNTNPLGNFDPWLSGFASETLGNNVDAYADLVGGDGFSVGDLRANTTSPNTFDYAYDTAAVPNASTNQIKASVTSLFYLNNWLHDYFYDSGFNEGAGNAQSDNLGRGGAQGDPLHAQAQDYSGTDNANMSTPADGSSPRMQMYVFTGAIKGNLSVQPLNVTMNNKPAAFGPNPFSTTAELILGNDSTGPDFNDACEAITNNVTGKIVLVNRGTCTFESKVLKAQQAGAVGVLITNNVAAGLPAMGEDPNTSGVTIGSLGIYQSDGDLLKTQLQSQTLTVTMAANPQSINRDGTLDNQIVAHEWGHYIHHRLVTDCPTLLCGAAPNQYQCSQCGGESEGWGDFNALLMTLRNGDNFASGTFAAAIYASDAFGDSAYFGIRRFAYSRDFAKNGLTFKHVTNGVALPTTPQNGSFPDNWEVHNSGEVWASMMFQAYTQLLLNGGHTFVEAKRRMADYVVAGMMLTPNNPTFTEQRDGLIAAARAMDANDALLLAQGFAARGAGTCAVSPPIDSLTGSGVVEDFNNGGSMQILGATLTETMACDQDGVLDTEEVGSVNVTIYNPGGGHLLNTSLSVTSGNPAVTFPNGNTLNIPSIAPGATFVQQVPIALVAGTTAIQDTDLAITTTNPAACVTLLNTTLSAQMNYDVLTLSSTTEEFENPITTWNARGAAGSETLAATIWSRRRQAVGDYRMNGADYTSGSDTALESPNLVLGPGSSSITFAHAFDFDALTGPNRYYDGGVIEVTNNNGATWVDVTTLGAAPGYSGTLEAGTGNTLAGRSAYGGRNSNWPNTNNVTLNFGNQFAGQTIKIRFRIGTDFVVRTPGAQGWFIDSIAVSNAANTPFHTITPDPLGCALCGGVTCNDGNPCTNDTCNGATNTCVFTNVGNGTSCNDGNGCTQSDTCQAGACVGASPVVCAALDQCHVAGTCNPSTGTCSNPNKANGTSCNDNNACTQSDSCQSGTCTGTNPVVCTAMDQCHQVGLCNPSTGICDNPNKPNGSSCTDSNGCTQTDTCLAGVCTGSNPVVCAAQDQCHVAGTCNPSTGACSNPNKANGASCNDGNACTQSDTCQSGACTGANPVICTALDPCHDAGSCNVATGQCSNPNKPDGTSCNDGNACSQVDTCQSGACAGGNLKTCPAVNSCYYDGTCNPATGQCSTPLKPTGTSCNDGNGCTAMDFCQLGTCIGSQPVVCGAPPDACHSPGVCNMATGVCDYALIGTDTDQDTVADACDNCPLVVNISQVNADNDVFGDVCDNCPFVSNASQADLDGDKQGDACDPDIDGDGVVNTKEMEIGTNPAKVDSDGDTIDDCTEACPANDGSCLVNGVCTFLSAANTDGDMAIDALDTDSDNDGVTDANEAGDANLTTPPKDSDGDGLPDYREKPGSGSGGMAGAAGMGGMAGAGNGGSGGLGGSGGNGGSAGKGGMAGAGNAGGMGGKGGMGGTAGHGGKGGATNEGGQGTGAGPVQNDGGCDCGMVSSEGTSSATGLLVALGALLTRIRRRKSRHGGFSSE